jgi:GT2 family glycosyltransferase
MSELPLVSVIIPTYHDWDRLRLCLAALEAQSYPQDRFEVLVVNNDPSDPPPYEVDGGNVRLLSEAKPGSYAARNRAIEEAKGEVFAFTDSDCIPDTDWLLNAVKIIKSGADRVGGAVELFSDMPDRENFPTAFQRCTAFRQKRNVTNGWAVTANMIARKQCFDEAGLFDSQMLSGGDQDWGRRAADASFAIEYAPEVKVNHPARASWEALFQKNRRVVGGAALLNKKRGGFRYAAFLIRQLMPPVSAWIMIIQDNKEKTVITKLQASFVALILKYHSLYFFLQVKTGLQSEQRG